jgi:hypothetical protein
VEIYVARGFSGWIIEIVQFSRELRFLGWNLSSLPSAKLLVVEFLKETSFAMDNVLPMDPALHTQLTQIEKSSKNSRDNEEIFKKGEWSDGAIHSLLDAYEAKWNHRNRGNLRVGDWEEVCSHVSNRSGGVKPLKTPAQCKNKIEGMKKKYRSEALESCSNNGVNCSSWPFFSRMDLMLRCPTRNAGIPGGMDAGYQGLSLMENGEIFGFHEEYHTYLRHPNHQESEQEEDVSNHLLQTNENFASILPESDTSAPGCRLVASPSHNHSPKPNPREKETRPNKAKLQKTGNKSCDFVVSSIKSFADSILKLQHTKMEMYKDAERLRSEAEEKRAELDLRRTEIIMNTQLQIAELLSCKSHRRKPAASTPVHLTTATINSISLDTVAPVNVIDISGQTVQSVFPGNQYSVPHMSFLQP